MDHIREFAEDFTSNGAGGCGAVDNNNDFIGNDISPSGKENADHQSPQKRRRWEDDDKNDSVDNARRRTTRRRCSKNAKPITNVKSSNGRNRKINPRENPYKTKPTVKIQPKVNEEWSKDPLTMDQLTAKMGLDDGAREAISAIMSYEGDDEILLCLKEGLEDALKIHNNFVAGGCKGEPDRAKAVKYHQKMGSLIQRLKFVANMPDLATAVTLAMAIMHYATMAEKDHKHRDEDLQFCRMDYDSPCPSLVVKAVPGMGLYHSIGTYFPPKNHDGIVVVDKICLCLDKEKNLDQQCKDFLNISGAAEFFDDKGVKLKDAMAAFIVPALIFNVCQIHYNTNEPVFVVAVGNPAAEMMRNECTSSTSHVHGCGKFIHPDQLTDGMKMNSEQACVNSDTCITEWLKAVLRSEFEEFGLSIDELRCYISFTLMFGNMSEEERQQVQDSLPSHILQQVAFAVNKNIHKHPPGTPRWVVAEKLNPGTEGIKPRWVQLYVKHSKSLAIVVVAEAVKNARPNHPDGTPVEEIVASLDNVDPKQKEAYLKSPGFAMHTVASAVKDAMPSHPPGTSREEIVAALPNIDPWMKNVYLKICVAPQDKVIQELQQQRQQAQQRLEGQDLVRPAPAAPTTAGIGSQLALAPFASHWAGMVPPVAPPTAGIGIQLRPCMLQTHRKTDEDFKIFYRRLYNDEVIPKLQGLRDLKPDTVVKTQQLSKKHRLALLSVKFGIFHRDNGSISASTVKELLKAELTKEENKTWSDNLSNNASSAAIEEST